LSAVLLSLINPGCAREGGREGFISLEDLNFPPDCGMIGIRSLGENRFAALAFNKDSEGSPLSVFSVTDELKLDGESLREVDLVSGSFFFVEVFAVDSAENIYMLYLDRDPQRSQKPAPWRYRELIKMDRTGAEDRDFNKRVKSFLKAKGLKIEDYSWRVYDGPFLVGSERGKENNRLVMVKLSPDGDDLAKFKYEVGEFLGDGPDPFSIVFSGNGVVYRWSYDEELPVETDLKVPPGDWKLLQPLKDGGWLCAQGYELYRLNRDCETEWNIFNPGMKLLPFPVWERKSARFIRSRAIALGVPGPNQVSPSAFVRGKTAFDGEMLAGVAVTKNDKGQLVDSGIWLKKIDED
jgi:hypothetical protein